MCVCLCALRVRELVPAFVSDCRRTGGAQAIGVLRVRVPCAGPDEPVGGSWGNGVARVHVPGVLLRTCGGDRVTLDLFAPLPGGGATAGTAAAAAPPVLSVTYSDGGARPPYVALNCSLAASRAAVECVTAPGVGTRHAWTLEVDGVHTAPSLATTSYAPPVLLSLNVRARACARGGLMHTGMSETTVPPSQAALKIEEPVGVGGRTVMYYELRLVGYDFGSDVRARACALDGTASDVCMSPVDVRGASPPCMGGVPDGRRDGCVPRGRGGRRADARVRLRRDDGAHCDHMPYIGVQRCVVWPSSLLFFLW